MISRDGFPQEERLTDLEIKDNCLGLLLAGHASTGAALMWAIKFLEENPDSKRILMVWIVFSIRYLYVWDSIYGKLDFDFVKSNLLICVWWTVICFHEGLMLYFDHHLNTMNAICSIHSYKKYFCELIFTKELQNWILIIIS